MSARASGDHIALRIVPDEATETDEVALPVADAAKHHHCATTKFDDNFLHRVVRDAGRWAYGTIFVEVWVLTENRTRLIRPRDGWWVDPMFLQTRGESFRRIIDSTNPDYVAPPSFSPGEGIPGVLWSEAARLPANRIGTLGTTFRNSNIMSRAVVWRDVIALAEDPDQPYNERLQLFALADVGWAAACPFRVNNEQGIVVFMARRGVDFARLRHPTNETYIKNAANTIGTAYALREPRLQAIDARRTEMRDAIVRVRLKLLQHIHQGKTLAELIEEKPPSQTSPNANAASQSKMAGIIAGRLNIIGTRLTTTARKIRGGGVKPPPTFSFFESFFSFLGAFISLLIITRLNVYLVQEQGSTDLAIVLP